MKPCLYLLPLLLLSCKKDAVITSATPKATDSITLRWDFNGDGKADNDIMVNLNNGKGHHKDGKTPDEWTLIFLNKTLPDLHITGAEPTPMGLGDLNEDGPAYLLIIQERGRMGSTWRFANGEWNQLEDYDKQRRPLGENNYPDINRLSRPYR